jgi:hypothetical protein
MKIALVDFPLLDVGGITTWNDAIKVGYEANGHQVNRYYATPQSSFTCNLESIVFIGDKTKRGMKLPAEHLSYNSKYIESTLETLKGFDLIHFIHPSPHPTKSNLAHEDMLGWLELYKVEGPKKITTMHDVNWEKTNEWFVYASPHLDLVIASQQPHWEAVQNYPTTADKMWSYFPMKIDEKHLNSITMSPKKRHVGMVAHQWIKWKHHEKIIKALDGVNSEMHFYAGGQQYHEMLKLGDLQKFIRDDYVGGETFENEQPMPHSYFGFIEHDKLVVEYGRNLFSIDGSTKGYNNYTHVEPMLYGCISMVHENVLAGSLNCIPEDACVSYTWDNLVEQIEWIKANPKKVSTIRKKAYEFITSNYECGAVAKKILSQLKKGKEMELDPISLLSHRMNIFPKIAGADGYECWGQHDEQEEVCKECPYNTECKGYVEKYGVRPDEVEPKEVVLDCEPDLSPAVDGNATGINIQINNPTGIQLTSLGLANIPSGQYTINVSYKASDM